jgi:hypothetical protein
VPVQCTITNAPSEGDAERERDEPLHSRRMRPTPALRVLNGWQTGVAFLGRKVILAADPALEAAPRAFVARATIKKEK